MTHNAPVMAYTALTYGSGHTTDHSHSFDTAHCSGIHGVPAGISEKRTNRLHKLYKIKSLRIYEDAFYGAFDFIMVFTLSGIS